MLELKDIHFTIRKGQEETHLLEKINLRVPTGHFMAIVGPSGCGKSTLLKLIAGINQESSGNIFWNKRNLSEEGDLEHAEIGYVPQFSIAYEALTVEENIQIGRASGRTCANVSGLESTHFARSSGEICHLFLLSLCANNDLFASARMIADLEIPVSFAAAFVALAFYLRYVTGMG